MRCFMNWLNKNNLITCIITHQWWEWLSWSTNYTTGKLVLREHWHGRPPVLKDQIFLAEGPTFQCNWPCHQTRPVLRDHNYMASGVVFQDRFYYIALISDLGKFAQLAEPYTQESFWLSMCHTLQVRAQADPIWTMPLITVGR